MILSKHLKQIILCGTVAAIAASCQPQVRKTYPIHAKSNTKTSGYARFIQKGNQVTLKLDVDHLTPGTHAVHLHQKADCSSPDGKSAGGHWNPTENMHGKWDSDHFHMGDIGNLEANDRGNATLTFTTDKWCIGCDDPSKNILNHGLIIHEGKDDFMSQPTGNAGGRVGCVEIK